MIRVDFVLNAFLISKRNCFYNRQKWPFLIIYIIILFFQSFPSICHILHAFRGSRRRWIPRLGKEETWLDRAAVTLLFSLWKLLLLHNIKLTLHVFTFFISIINTVWGAPLVWKHSNRLQFSGVHDNGKLHLIKSKTRGVKCLTSPTYTCIYSCQLMNLFSLETSHHSSPPRGRGSFRIIFKNNRPY